MSHHFEIFKTHILERSVEKHDLAKALLEWKLESFSDLGSYGNGSCCCTHNIRYLWEIINVEMDYGNKTPPPPTHVGSSCIKKVIENDERFRDKSVDNIFNNIEKMESLMKRLPKLKLKFGQHKNRFFTDIPKHYCNWWVNIYENDKISQYRINDKVRKNMQDFYLFSTYIERED